MTKFKKLLNKQAINLNLLSCKNFDMVVKTGTVSLKNLCMEIRTKSYQCKKLT